MTAPQHWGTTPDERARCTPADDLVPHPVARWTRGVPTTAPPARQYRWLQQLTVAPYSYDLVDNLGRRSPTTLTPGADELHVGQPLLVLFVVDSFVDGEHLTIRRSRRGRGPVAEFAVTYAVAPGRLTATVVLDGTRGIVGNALRTALAWGDLVMMRRQLHRLAALAAD